MRLNELRPGLCARRTQKLTKMSKIKTIKNIFMNSSDVLLKNSDTSKHIAVFTWKSLKIGCSSFTVIWTKFLSSKLLNYHSFNVKLLES